MAGIRLTTGAAVSVFGVHLTYRSPALFKRQIKYIAEVASREQARGNDVVLAGDWNESTGTITANPEFGALSLVSSVSKEWLTCPTYLPRFLQKPLDHVFVPPSWRRIDSETIAFGSDHLVLAVKARPHTRLLAGEDISATSGVKIANSGGSECS